MPLEENRTDSFPGAGAMATLPFSVEDCKFYPTREALAAEMHGRGVAVTWRAGALWVGATLEEVFGVCFYEFAEIYSVVPDPLVISVAATVNGAKFTEEGGEVWLGDAVTWEECTMTAKQPVTTWGAEAISITVVSNALPPEPAHVYVYVKPTKGWRNKFGFETELTVGLKIGVDGAGGSG